jgi:hypothetical protein
MFLDTAPALFTRVVGPPLDILVPDRGPKQPLIKVRMPRGDKSKYTDKQKRQAEHIERDNWERILVAPYMFAPGQRKGRGFQIGPRFTAREPPAPFGDYAAGFW